jgi:hypothetical protein
MLAIALKDMEILGRFSICFQKEAIKGVVDFEDGKVFKVLANALDRQGFFIEGFVPDFVAPPGNSFLTYRPSE